MKKRLFAAAALLALVLTGCAQPPSPAADSVSPPENTPPPAVSVPAEEAPPVEEPELETEPPTMQDQARTILEGMTREEVVGQLFFVRYPGDSGLAAQWAKDYHLGGYILFGRDFKEDTPDGVRAKIAASQAASSIPMLMGVDEEGGTVVRASYYPAFRAEKFQSPQKLFAQGGLEAIRADALEKSTFLKDLGINVNLAPVVDVSTDPDDFIYDRAFGQGAEETAEYAAVVVNAMKEQGMGSVLKHFPGYGNNVDTHTGIAYDTRPLEQFLTGDLLPFRSGGEAGAGAVLVSHNIVTCLDETLPASLSPAAYKLLREEAGFSGVAMTDDLDMAAVGEYVEDGSAVVQALSAGADMVLTSDPEHQIPLVFSALEEGTLTWSRVRYAALRVLTWKIELGLISP